MILCMLISKKSLYASTHGKKETGLKNQEDVHSLIKGIFTLDVN